MTDKEKAVKLLSVENLNPIAKCVHEIFETRKIMSTLNGITDKIITEETHTAKIENDVKTTIGNLIKKVEKIEKSSQEIYKISNVSADGLS